MFLCDALITKCEQDRLNLNLEFVSYALTHGTMFRVYDGIKQRYMYVPPSIGSRKTSLVYGGIFIINDYELNKVALHSYYNNSMPFMGKTIQEDLYDLKKITCTPIKINTLLDIQNRTYKQGDSVECYSFIGNMQNKKVSSNIKKHYCRVSSGLDIKNQILLAKEINIGK